MQPKVPVGPTTVVGYGTTLTTAITAVLAYVFADGDEQTLGVVAAGVVALGSLVVTQLGRMGQAKEQIKASAPTSAPRPYTEMTRDEFAGEPLELRVTPEDEQRDLHDGGVA